MIVLAAASIPGWGQVPPVPPAPALNAWQTRNALQFTLQRYPHQLAEVLSIDPSLLSNQTYLAPYPDLVNFLNAHPEVVRSPSFYLGEPFQPQGDQHGDSVGAWRSVAEGFETLIGVCLGLGLVAWLMRSLMDHRRWNRLNKVQTEVHTRLLERLTGNEELMAYIQSPAGSKFLESSPIALDQPRSAGAPISRILWTVQAGVVIAAGGAGLLLVAARTADEVTRPLQAFGTLGIALGTGFVISAIISFMISHRLGLIEIPARTRE